MNFNNYNNTSKNSSIPNNVNNGYVNFTNNSNISPNTVNMNGNSGNNGTTTVNSNLQLKRKIIGVLRDNENTNNAIDPAHIKRRLEWTKEWLNKCQFNSPSSMGKIMPELRAVDEIYHFNNHFKMTELQFRYLVQKIGPLITQQEPQRKKKFFSAEERLAIALKYLATGEVHSCKHYCFKATQNVIISMITDICMKIYENLKDDFLRLPKTSEDWRKISKGFYDEYQLPNCIGAIEGRHILYKAPKIKSQCNNVANSNNHSQNETNTCNLNGNSYLSTNGNSSGDKKNSPCFNNQYQKQNQQDLRNHFQQHQQSQKSNINSNGQNTIVLLTLIDSHGNFIFADVNMESYLQESKIFDRSTFKQLIDNDVLNLPKNDNLPGSNILMPNYMVGKNYFPLRSYIMKPLLASQHQQQFLNNKQIYFNYKLRAISQKADHCLDMLLNMFPIFLHPFKLSLEDSKKVTLGCIALYNFLRKSLQQQERQGGNNNLNTTVSRNVNKLNGNSTHTTRMEENSSKTNNDCFNGDNNNLNNGINNINKEEENFLHVGSLMKFQSENIDLDDDDERAKIQRNILIEYSNNKNGL